jgi:hypothetical protein
MPSNPCLLIESVWCLHPAAAMIASFEVYENSLRDSPATFTSDIVTRTVVLYFFAQRTHCTVADGTERLSSKDDAEI